MGKVIISAALGIAAAGAVMAAPYAGIHITPAQMMMIAAALSVGAAVAMLTGTIAAKSRQDRRKISCSPRSSRKPVISSRNFRSGGDILSLSIKPDTLIDRLEVVADPGKCITRDIYGHAEEFQVRRNSILSNSSALFVALKDQPGFIHLVLDGQPRRVRGLYSRVSTPSGNSPARTPKCRSRNMSTTYSPTTTTASICARSKARENPTSSATKTKISDAIVKMAGGFRRLIVLRRGYHRRPIGLVNFSDLMSETLSEQTKPAMRSLLGR